MKMLMFLPDVDVFAHEQEPLLRNLYLHLPTRSAHIWALRVGRYTVYII